VIESTSKPSAVLDGSQRIAAFKPMHCLVFQKSTLVEIAATVKNILFAYHTQAQ